MKRSIEEYTYIKYSMPVCSLRVCMLYEYVANTKCHRRDRSTGPLMRKILELYIENSRILFRMLFFIPPDVGNLKTSVSAGRLL
jgi:hypothetical protein